MAPSIGSLMAMRSDTVEGAQQMEENLKKRVELRGLIPQFFAADSVLFHTLSARRKVTQLEIGPRRAYN